MGNEKIINRIAAALVLVVVMVTFIFFCYGVGVWLGVRYTDVSSLIACSYLGSKLYNYLVKRANEK